MFERKWNEQVSSSAVEFTLKFDPEIRLNIVVIDSYFSQLIVYFTSGDEECGGKQIILPSGQGYL